MRRTRIGTLGTLLLLAAAACGAESRLGTYADPQPGDGISGSAGPVWATALAALGQLRTASYSATLTTRRCVSDPTTECSLTTQTIRANGTFSLGPDLLLGTLRVQNPAPGATGITATSAEVRELADGSLYSSDATDPDGCWTRWDKTYKKTFEASFRYGLEVLRSAEVSYDLPAGSSATALNADANALAVVRTLGLLPELDATYGITPAVRRKLARTTVSIDVTVGADGSPVSFRIAGPRVATEIDPAADPAAISYLTTVRRAWSTYSLTDLGTPAPRVVAPPAGKVLPRNAAKGATC